MPLPPTERQWPTATGKAMFSVFSGLHEDAAIAEKDTLRLITLRSHDQYNTTIYAWMIATAGFSAGATFCS